MQKEALHTVFNLWKLLGVIVVTTIGLGGFKRGLSKFMEENSTVQDGSPGSEVTHSSE